MLWLSKVYGIPAGMYASQVWGTEYLSEGSHLTWQPVTEEASVFLEAHSWSEEQHNKLGGAQRVRSGALAIFLVPCFHQVF